MEAVQINEDVAQAAVVHGASIDWVPSPAPGVERKLLERTGGEVALATSIVRYAPGRAFPAHVHGAGEEFLVLEGTFSDEHGDYPPLTYVRNPPGSRHAPRSDGGCTIFVKLRQMNESERGHVVVRSGDIPEGRRVLYERGPVEVELHRLPPGGTLQLDACRGGEEIFVVDGSVQSRGMELARWAWWRRPANDGCAALVSAGGAMLWVKRGHLDRREG